MMIKPRAIGSAHTALSLPAEAENALDPTIAINPRGDAVVAWEVDGSTSCVVRAAFACAGRRWSRPHTVSDATAGCPAWQQASIDERGRAIVTWSSQRGRTSYLQSGNS
jgi:hypothetical protein